MKRDEAEKLIDSLTDAAQECECAEFLNDFKLSESASKKIDKLRAKLLAALAPETSQPVDLHKEIMDIPVDEDKIVKHLADETNLQRAYKIGHRDARHAAAEIVAGRWRKVKP